jgi:hypothetical protein
MFTVVNYEASHFEGLADSVKHIKDQASTDDVHKLFLNHEVGKYCMGKAIAKAVERETLATNVANLSKTKDGRGSFYAGPGLLTDKHRCTAPGNLITHLDPS